MQPVPSGRPSAAETRHAIDVAAGREPADLALRGALVLDPFDPGLRPAEVRIAGRLIAAVADADAFATAPPARTTTWLDGGVLTPGLIDGHVHLESSLVAPARYAETVLPRGVTGVVCDPHEIANVAGEAGVRWLLRRAQALPFDVWLTVPSCVPATELETTGARLEADAIARLMELPMAVGLAELMSFPQVLAGEAAVLAKAAAAEAAGGTVEGHAPALAGADLQAYAAAGVHSDHETASHEEGLAKLRAGLFLWLREGSVARDAAALAPLATLPRSTRFGFCSDDVLPHDLATDGGVDHALRVAVRHGGHELAVLIGATFAAARHYRLPRRGAVAPGYLADLVHWRDPLADFAAARVFKEGREVARDGVLTHDLATPSRRTVAEADVKPDATSDAASEAALRRSVQLPEDLAARLDAALRWRDDLPHQSEAPAIGVLPNDLRTQALTLRVPRRNGSLAADPERDLCLLACAERHGRSGAVAAVPLAGFGLRHGALAVSVGHDHHNLMVAFAEPSDAVAAWRRIERLQGGFVAVQDGRVLAELPLPLGGLLTDAPLAEVLSDLDALDDAARALGCQLQAPAMALSFLGLAVIPERKLTDRGLVDVNAGRLLPVPWGVPPASAEGGAATA